VWLFVVLFLSSVCVCDLFLFLQVMTKDLSVYPYLSISLSVYPSVYLSGSPEVTTNELVFLHDFVFFIILYGV